MDATQRYELIRPILHKEKTIGQVHSESGISIRTLGRYLKQFRIRLCTTGMLAIKPTTLTKISLVLP